MRRFIHEEKLFLEKLGEKMDTVLRYYEMFNLIPVGEQNAISTTDLLKKLEKKGYPIGLRTLERDLEKTSGTHGGLFPLSSSEGKKPIRWFWTEHLQFPMMSIDEALAFKLNEMFIQPVLPSTCKRLEGYYKQANDRLAKNNLGAWADKIRIKMPDQASLMNNMFEQLDIVATALVHEKQFSADFKNQSCLFNPLGLVFELGNAKLVATIDDDTIVLKLGFFQFQNAKMTENNVVTPENFNLDDYT